MAAGKYLRIAAREIYITQTVAKKKGVGIEICEKQRTNQNRRNFTDVRLATGNVNTRPGPVYK